MEEVPEMPLQEKLDFLTSGKLPLQANFKTPSPSLEDRIEPYRMAEGVYDRTNINWPNKMSTSPPGPTTTGYDFVHHKQFSGINFATQDYMSLCYNKGSIDAAVEAYKRYGSHSGGSPLFFGKHPYYLEVLESLKRAFKPLWNDPQPMIFSAGWLAGFGVVSSLTSKKDHIIIDELCHNCLKFGARNSFATIHNVHHLDSQAMCDKIVEIRQKYPTTGIVVVTEGLFSMDSDCADLDKIQQVAKQQNAVLVVDCAHDMFGYGKIGLGNPGDRIKDFSNVVLVGSGSKSLANNFGWTVSGYKGLPTYMSFFAGSFTFSNALAPAVAANVSYNIDLLMGPDGFARRKRSMENVNYIRKRLTDAGFEIYGDPSPVVIVLIGSELISRTISNMMYDEGIIVNCVEYPACDPGDSRLRLQVQCDHTREHLDKFVDTLVRIMPKVDEYLANDKFATTVSTELIKYMTGSQPQQKL